MILSKMSAQTENISPNTVDPYEEVKKLQSLVQKLEHQNEQLLKNQIKSVKEEKDNSCKDRRSKSLGGVIIDNGINPKILNLSIDFDTKKLNPYVEEEFIDVDELHLSDDDSWLYTPPNGLSSEEMSLSPYKWLRKDLEDPKNKELQLAKSALVNKLEELSILSTPSQQDAEIHITSEDKILSETEVPLEQARVIDTRTFTRSKKKKNSKEEDSAKALPLPIVTVEPAISNGENGDDHSPIYDFGYIRPELHQLSDFIDVHEKARMQEESLKQDTPVISRGGSCSLPRPRKLSNCRLESIDAVSDTEEIFANHVDNGRRVIRRPLTSTPTTQKSFSSMHSSPLGSNSSLSNAKVPSSLRRSLPNLARGNTNKRPPATKSPNSTGLSFLPHRYGSPSPRQHLQLPTQNTRRESAPNVVYQNSLQDAHSPASTTSVHNPQNFHKSNLPVSSRVQGRSSLPRPSKLPTPRPKLPVPLNHPRKSVAEETWSDGCF